MTDVEVPSRLDVSRETIARLLVFKDLLLKWNTAINLISPTTTDDVWTRHVIDSAQVFQFSQNDWANWIDLGSGGGLPGVIVAIMDPGSRPVTLVESDQRKCQFLQTVRRALDLNLHIENLRIDQFDAGSGFDALSARALAPVDQLVSYADRLLRSNGRAYLPKGATYQQELDQAAVKWQFDLETHVSVTDPNARILEISRIRRREP